MKVLKYVFLLIILTIIALSVFVATQNSNYSFTKSKEIHHSKHIVFNYLDDLKNFEQWQVFNEKASNYRLDSIYKGKNSFLAWKNGSIKTTESYPNDSLVQNLNINNEESILKWTLKSTEKGTEIKLEIEGKMNFMTKFKSLFNGGIEKIKGYIFEKALNSLQNHLTKEYSENHITNEGIILTKETFFIKQTINCKIENLEEYVINSIKNMKVFCIENNLKITGDPFTVFESLNTNSNEISYSVFQPIETEIFTNEGSDITGGKTQGFYAYKTILIGAYSHTDKAWKENKKGITENNLTIISEIKPISIYKKTRLDSNKPSEWITELLTPINEFAIQIPETINDSLITQQ